MRSLEEINKEINSKKYPTFPFINLNNRITKLKKGLYKKHKSNFRGITCVNVPVGDEMEAKFEIEVRLNGFYNIPYDMVIVPDNVIMTEKKKMYLKVAREKGYKRVKNLPHMKPLVFGPETEEYFAAMEARKKYVEEMQIEKYYKDKMNDTFKEYSK